MISRRVLVRHAPLFLAAVLFLLGAGDLLLNHRYRMGPRQDNFGYGWEIGRVGRSLALNQGFASPLPQPTGPTAWMAPVYPCVVAAAFRGFGVYTEKSAVVLLLLNCLFTALTCVVLIRITRAVFGEAVALAAGVLWLVFSPIYWGAVDRISDAAIATWLCTSTLWATLCLRKGASGWAWAGFGLLWALAGATNAAWLPLFPVALAWLLMETRPMGEARIRRAALAAAVCLAALLPWFIRNYIVMGRLIPLRSNFPLELRVGNAGDASGLRVDALHPAWNALELKEYQRLGEMAYMDRARREAWRAIKGDPWAMVQATARRVLDWWVDPWSWRATAVSWLQGRPAMGPRLVISCSFTLLTLVGLRLALRDHKWEGILLAAPLLLFPLANYITHVAHSRYRHPIEPVMTILAAYALVRLYCEWLPRPSAVS